MRKTTYNVQLYAFHTDFDAFDFLFKSQTTETKKKHFCTQRAKTRQ